MIVNLKLSIKLIFSAIFLITNLNGQGYEGVKKCRICHQLEKQGNQYSIWLKGPHAKAFESLNSKKAQTYANEKNIVAPSKNRFCLNCHTTYENVPDSLRGPNLTYEEGVSCESCHGPGSFYSKYNIMRNVDIAIKKGLIIRDELICRNCHTPGCPFYIEFEVDKAIEKIAHPKPDSSVAKQKK